MTKTILVVDDDPAVLQSYGRLLRRLGHRVLLSEDSEQVMTTSVFHQPVETERLFRHSTKLILLRFLAEVKFV